MHAPVEPMLLESARLGLAIREAYAHIKRDHCAKFYTYVLQLQDNKFYVGNTDNIYTRLLDHTLMTPSSALWVKHHGPVQRVLEVCRNCSRSDEHYKTLQYMAMFGWQNVRGSSYCKVQMFRPPEALEAFLRDRDHEFEYLSRKEIEHIMEAVQTLHSETTRKA